MLGIKVFPVFRRYSKQTALLFLVVCVISCMLDAIHNAAVMSMLSFSQNYLNNAAANLELYQAAGAAVSLARRSAYIAQLIAIGVWIFVFYISFWRFALIPRTLAAVGLFGIALQFTGVTLMMFSGYSVIGQMAMPMLPIQIVVGLWLIVKGFNERLSGTDTEAIFE